ncbi:TadE/TadG family type IV pilus assembly protein [Aliiruegeria sabulilitoris]|uniref:TadE/TadG family type IV pilus assembly protein n=1 Tax=Aliiruegeria sabulilitoris TaxID=1510458 RepID=UPI000830CC09|nr:hypothetical protein [Aliiruegeria sabulilitoris]NDR59617.1 hypothetical protein [Pseudoruegeria sp. M32A2M]
MSDRIFRPARLALRQFRDRTDGSLSVEAAIIMPLLCAVYVGSFVWFDAFRMQNVNLKATYTIADMISRETDGVDPDYFDGMDDIYAYLTYGNYETHLRLTIIECTEECEDDSARVLEVCWSKASEGRDILTTEDLQARANEVPIFPLGDELIVAETFMAYSPAFDVGLDPQVFENTVFTAPRMSGQMKFTKSNDSVEHCYNN